MLDTILIYPKALNGHLFILVAIDYFIKWVEAKSYAHVTSKVVVHFLKCNLIAHYGLLEAFNTNNVKNLNNQLINDFMWAI